MPKFAVIIISFLLSLVIPAVYAGNIDKMIVFGDSLSDNGNIFFFTTNAHKITPRIPVIPKIPYFAGRFSNGPVWAENLAQTLNVPLSDYAYGGAWAEPFRDSKLLIPFGLGMQVNFYLVAAALDFHRENHLYVIWAGANDYIDGRGDAETATTNVIASIQNQIEWLTYYGAKNFLIMTIPDLGMTPELTNRGPDDAVVASKISRMHNDKLLEMVAKEKELHPEVKFVSLDVIDYFDDAMAHPEKYSLKNVREACYGGSYSWQKRMNPEEVRAAKDANIDLVNNTVLRNAYLHSIASMNGEGSCNNPDEYFFWDELHPTRLVHSVLATLALNKLNENDLRSKRK